MPWGLEDVGLGTSGTRDGQACAGHAEVARGEAGKVGVRRKLVLSREWLALTYFCQYVPQRVGTDGLRGWRWGRPMAGRLFGWHRGRRAGLDPENGYEVGRRFTVCAGRRRKDRALQISHCCVWPAWLATTGAKTRDQASHSLAVVSWYITQPLKGKPICEAWAKAVLAPGQIAFIWQAVQCDPCGTRLFPVDGRQQKRAVSM